MEIEIKNFVFFLQNNWYITLFILFCILTSIMLFAFLLINFLVIINRIRKQFERNIIENFEFDGIQSLKSLYNYCISIVKKYGVNKSQHETPIEFAMKIDEHFKLNFNEFTIKYLRYISINNISKDELLIIKQYASNIEKKIQDQLSYIEKIIRNINFFILRKS